MCPGRLSPKDHPCRRWGPNVNMSLSTWSIQLVIYMVCVCMYLSKDWSTDTCEQVHVCAYVDCANRYGEACVWVSNRNNSMSCTALCGLDMSACIQCTVWSCKHVHHVLSVMLTCTVCVVSLIMYIFLIVQSNVPGVTASPATNEEQVSHYCDLQAVPPH